MDMTLWDPAQQKQRGENNARPGARCACQAPRVPLASQPASSPAWRASRLLRVLVVQGARNVALVNWKLNEPLAASKAAGGLGAFAEI